MINKIPIFIIAFVNAFRLLTLDPLGENHKNIFIANVNSHLKLMKASPENITNFYVVVHSNKVYFYTKGNYYTFSYDSDNFKLKLSQVEPGKINFFTQEDSPKVLKKTKGIRFMDWNGKPSLSKVREKRIEKVYRKNPSPVLVEQEIIEDEPEEKPEKIFRRRSRSPVEQEVIEDEPEEKPEKIFRRRSRPPVEQEVIEDEPTEKIPLKRHAEDDENEIPFISINKKQILDQNISISKEIDQKPKKFMDNFHAKGPSKKNSEIESDSEIVGPKALDITIEIVNKKNKSFLLKNDKDLCVTYLKKEFLLAECTNSKRQIFRLAYVKDILKNFEHDDGKIKKSEEEEILKEISSSSDDFKGFDKDEKNKNFNKKNEKKDKRSKDHQSLKKTETKTKNSVAPTHTIKSNEEDNPESSDSSPNQAPDQYENKSKVDWSANSFTNSSIHHNNSPKTIFNSIPNLEQICKSLIKQNFGKFKGVPPGCEGVMKTVPFSVNKTVQGPPFQMKINSNVKSQFSQPRKQNQPVNLLERLERETKI